MEPDRITIILFLTGAICIFVAAFMWTLELKSRHAYRGVPDSGSGADHTASTNGHVQGQKSADAETESAL